MPASATRESPELDHSSAAGSTRRLLASRTMFDVLKPTYGPAHLVLFLARRSARAYWV